MHSIFFTRLHLQSDILQKNLIPRSIYRDLQKLKTCYLRLYQLFVFIKEIYGYKEYLPIKITTWTAIILTAGLLRLVFHWWPKLMLYTTHRPCNLATATKLLVIVSYIIFIFIYFALKQTFSLMRVSFHAEIANQTKGKTSFQWAHSQYRF